MKMTISKNARIYILLVLFTAPLLVNAQPPRQRFHEQARELESKRIAFITNELSLTPEEAQVFWPIYNEYNQYRNEMMIRHRTARTDTKELEKMSESELIKLADADINNMEEMIALRRRYHEKFMRVLPVKKVILLYDAERKFNRQLFREGRSGQQRRRN